jgi:hypothetical protein
VAVDLPGNQAVIQTSGGGITVSDGSDNLFAAPLTSIGAVDVNGGIDDDTIALDLSDLPAGGLLLDGGAGANTLAVTDSNTDLTATSLISAQNFGFIDATDSGVNEITIDASAVATLSPTSNTIRVIVGLFDSIRFTDAPDWRMTEPSIEAGNFIRVATNQVTGEIVEVDGPADWQNPIEPSDVNNDGEVTAGDALLIINELDRRMYADPDTQELVDPVMIDPFPGTYYDQNADWKNTALDALRVINRLARISNGGEQIGQGEFVLQAWRREPAQTSSADLTRPIQCRIPADRDRDLPAIDSSGPRSFPTEQVVARQPAADSEPIESWADRVDHLLSHATFLSPGERQIAFALFRQSL